MFGFYCICVFFKGYILVVFIIYSELYCLNIMKNVSFCTGDFCAFYFEMPIKTSEYPVLTGLLDASPHADIPGQVTKVSFLNNFIKA